jgi:hypothetical protein
MQRRPHRPSFTLTQRSWPFAPRIRSLHAHRQAPPLAALRHSDLPIAELEGPSREVKLSDHRHDLVAQRTRIASQTRWHLHELDPDLVIPSRGLKRHRAVAVLLNELVRVDGWGPASPAISSPGAMSPRGPTDRGHNRPKGPPSEPSPTR